jgi:hypothetical protein
MWQLADSRASFSFGPLAGQVNLAKPEVGLQSIRVGGAAWTDASLLRVRLPSGQSAADAKLAESYVRGCDLVATYDPLPPFTLQPQIYWRLREFASLAACGIELILSVKTSQLYSEPQTPVGSQIARADSITTWSADGRSQSIAASSMPLTLREGEGGQGIVAFEPAIGGYIYVEMIHPSDFRAIAIETAPGGRLCTAVEIFQEHLEKGVIRRARVGGWFLPQADWRTHAWELYQTLAAEPPPLTA